MRLSSCLVCLCLAFAPGCLRKAPAGSSTATEAAVAESKVAEPKAAEPPIVIPDGPERPDVASPRRVEQPWMSLAEWRRRHEKQLRAPHRAEAKLLVLGDSIVEGWCDSAAFRAQFGDQRPLNLGVGGDQTQHLLWRIDQGILDGLSPRAVIVLIGVNNLGAGFSPDETLLGIRAVIERARQKLPAAPILLLDILPAGQTKDDGLRVKIVATNAQLSALAVPGKVHVADVGAVLLESDGSITKTMMGDFLHPTGAGYTRLSTAVRPLVDAMTGEK